MAQSAASQSRRSALRSYRVALNVGFVALGVALSFASIPIGPAKVFPFQHMINILVAVLVGPWDAMLVAAIIGVIRNAMGTGTILALTAVFGGMVVGLIYRHVWRNDGAALFEWVGSVVIGGAAGWLIVGSIAQPTKVLGFMAAGTPKPFLGVNGMLGLMIAFAVSVIPGDILGFIVLKALRAAGLMRLAE